MQLCKNINHQAEITNAKWLEQLPYHRHAFSLLICAVFFFNLPAFSFGILLIDKVPYWEAKI